MTSVVLYACLLAVVAVERVAELVVSQRHLRWSRERGGREIGRRHYPFMVAAHAALFPACLAEVVVLQRPFHLLLGWVMITAVVASQALRWWSVAALGVQWNTRVVVVPGMPRVVSGPYRWMRHPNYVAVAVEGGALPLVHSAWITAVAFTMINAVLLTIRIRCENRALTLLVRPT